MKLTIKLLIENTEQTLEAQRGERLSDVLARYHIPLDLPCGGKGICKSCPVSIDGKVCLSCQTRLEHDIRVEVDGTGAMQNVAAGDVPNRPPVNPMFAQYGIGVDIGTTTVCAALLRGDGWGDTVTWKNPQASFGADVISRMEHALSGGMHELAEVIHRALSEMIGDLCARHEIDPAFIDALVVTGNTAMLYFLTEQNPAPLSRAPFWADRLFGEFVPARDVGLPVSPSAPVYLPRCISAFVGGDITCAILASGMRVKGKTRMLVDIGTNGEIVLWHDDVLTCCSTAAGPALEGAGVTHGIYGVRGAIDHVWQEDGAVRCSTIGGGSAKGICGSGIVDAVALMLELGIIDETGAFSDEADGFTLKDGIGITAADVRKVQLAKGAIRAGIETLLEIGGVKKAEVETLYIAGGFGSLINLKSAAGIGLIPREMIDQTKVIGNAAYTGATMLLGDESLINTAAHLAEQARTVSLEASPVFTNHYMNYMMF